MISGRARLTLAATFCLLTLSAVVPTYGVSTTYLTTGITHTGIKQSTLGPSNGVLVNYTSTYSSSFRAFVYLDLTNATTGQTVYWTVDTCNFAAGQKVPCFVVIAPTVPKGTYMAWTFATTNSSIPVSTLSSVKVTL